MYHSGYEKECIQIKAVIHKTLFRTFSCGFFWFVVSFHVVLMKKIIINHAVLILC